MEVLLIIKIVSLGIGIGVGVYFAKYLKPFIAWLQHGIENGDGRLEHKDLQILIFSSLAIFIVFTIAFLGIVYPDALIYSVFGAATGMFVGKQFSEKK